LANTDSRPVQDTMDFLAGRLNITKDQAIEHIAQSSFLKVSATVQDTANVAVLIASERAHADRNGGECDRWCCLGLMLAMDDDLFVHVTAT
jgi:hypothetical protein